MQHVISIGTGINTKGHDYLGLALSWGAPQENSTKNQYGIEMFYALQLTEHLNITPELQLTFNPSFNEEKSFVGV